MPAASLQVLQLRARLYARVREFLSRRGLLEVETPILSAAANTDPNIRSFETRFNGRPQGDPRRWLRTSPEFALKRLLAAGVGDCYELGRVFRDGEAGRRHNPEFTLLEWYRLGFDHHRLMGEVADLVAEALDLVGRQAQVRRIAYRDLFRQRLGVDPMRASESNLQAALGSVRIDPAGLERDDWLDLLMTHRLQPGFAPHELWLVYDFPASQCALARLEETGGDVVARRFEVFLGPLELANGYHELCDAAEQARRFEADRGRRDARGTAQVPRDDRLLAALGHGLPECAGVALGVDRLLAAMTGLDIPEVLAFPWVSA